MNCEKWVKRKYKKKWEKKNSLVIWVCSSASICNEFLIWRIRFETNTPQKPSEWKYKKIHRKQKFCYKIRLVQVLSNEADIFWFDCSNVLWKMVWTRLVTKIDRIERIVLMQWKDRDAPQHLIVAIFFYMQLCVEFRFAHIAEQMDQFYWIRVIVFVKIRLIPNGK